MRKRIIWLLLLCPLFTACESVSDRLYSRALGITDEEVYLQTLEGEKTLSGSGATYGEALRYAQGSAGGKIITGHTELLCVDSGFTPEKAEMLLFDENLSPGCRLLFTDVENYFENADSDATVRTLRTAEEKGILPRTELALALEEWLGSGETALIPISQNGTIGMVFMKKDGAVHALSENAVRGMVWLRQSCKEIRYTLQGSGKSEDLTILGSSCRKTQEDGELVCTVAVRLDGRDSEVQEYLREQILRECLCALEEMNAAGADTVGMEMVLGELPENPRIRVEVEIIMR